MKFTKTLIIMAILAVILPKSALSNSTQEFIDKAKEGDIESVEYFINTGIDVNCIDESGFTPLILAAQYGHYEISNLLILNGANVNHKNKYGGSALMYAAGNGHIEIVKLFLRNNARVSAMSFDGSTSLKLAKKNHHLTIVKLLLANGAGKRISLYSWFDDKGNIYYSETKRDVPSKYRKNVSILTPATYNPAGIRRYEEAYRRQQADKTERDYANAAYKSKKDALDSARSMIDNDVYRSLSDKLGKQHKKNLSDLDDYKRRREYSQSEEGRMKRRISDLEFEQEQRMNQLERKQQQLEIDRTLDKVLGR